MNAETGITGTGINIGGLIGFLDAYSFLEQCYVEGGNIRGRAFVGGLVGIGDASIENCWSSADVRAISHGAGLIGDSTCSSLWNCYSTGYSSQYGLIAEGGCSDVCECFWDMNTSHRSTSEGGTGLYTPQMQMLSTYLNAGWDFNNIWAICEGTNYPRFIWQIPAGDIICPDGVDIFDLAELCEQWLVLEIPADLAPPPTGDGIVNFADFSIFADQWPTTNDINDLLDFSRQWLKTGFQYCSADINGDSKVDEVDFALMAENWLR